MDISLDGARARCNHVCNKFGLWELVNLPWLKNINKEGMAMLGMKYDRSVWKKTLVARIQEDGRRQWRNGFGINEREQQYVHMKSQPKNEKYANGSVGARVRLMVRGGCLPVEDIYVPFFSQRVIHYWNALPQTAIDAKSINKFKSQLKIYLNNIIRGLHKPLAFSLFPTPLLN